MKLQANLEENIIDETRFDRIRIFNLYYLAFVAFVVGYGRIFSLSWVSFGKHPENILPIPILLTLYLVIYERGYKWPITYREKVFAVYVFFVSLMPFWGLYLDASLNALKEFWAATIFGILILYNVRDEKSIRVLVFSFLLGVLFKNIVYNLDYLIKNEQVRTIFIQKYGAADFVLAPVALCLGLFFYFVNGVAKKTLLCGIFFLLFFGIIKADSRSSLMAIIFAITVFSVIFSRKFAFVSVLLTLIISGSIYFSPNSHLSNMILSVKWKDRNVQTRVKEIYPASIVIYKDHNPIWGIGFGSFARIASSEEKYSPIIKSERPTHSHNIFLQALVTQGIIGLSIVLFFIFQIISMSLQVLYEPHASTFTKAIGCSGFIWIVSLATSGLVNHEFHNSRFIMGIALMITVIILSYYTAIMSKKKIEEKTGALGKCASA